jgi:hypothetical protein
MTTTSFYPPASIEQVTVMNELTHKPSIDWDKLDAIISKDSYTISKLPLHTISGFWQEKFLSNTSQIVLTNFNFPSTNRTLTGIEFQLGIQRAGRIEDLQIQLSLNGDLIGDNLASTINPVQSDMYTGDYTTPLTPVGDYHIYGATDNLWGTELTSADILNPTFGIVIAFKSNQIYPHNDLAYVNQVALRVSYA